MQLNCIAEPLSANENNENFHRVLLWKKTPRQEKWSLPSEEIESCLKFQLKANYQVPDLPFGDFLWKCSYLVEELLPNEKYIARKLKANKIQTPKGSIFVYLENLLKSPINSQEFNWQNNGSIIKHQDEWHTLAWKEHFRVAVFDTLS